MSAAEVRVDIRRSTPIDPRTPAAGAYLDIDQDVTITFGDAWRDDWRSSALDAIDNLAQALDTLRERVADGRMQRPSGDIPTAVRS